MLSISQVKDTYRTAGTIIGGTKGRKLWRLVCEDGSRAFVTENADNKAIRIATESADRSIQTAWYDSENFSGWVTKYGDYYKNEVRRPVPKSPVDEIFDKIRENFRSEQQKVNEQMNRRKRNVKRNIENYVGTYPVGTFNRVSKPYNGGTIIYEGRCNIDIDSEGRILQKQHI